MKNKLKYHLYCTLCGKKYAPDPYRLHCDQEYESSLLRAIYSNKKLEVKEKPKNALVRFRLKC